MLWCGTNSNDAAFQLTASLTCVWFHIFLFHGLQGPKDVYRGLTGAVLGTIPTAILYFATYEWCKARLEARKAPSAVTHLASASAGAVMSAFIRVPTDTVKHRVQAYMETNVFLVSLPCSRACNILRHALCWVCCQPILETFRVSGEACVVLQLIIHQNIELMMS